MTSDREQILGRVTRALAPLASRAALPDWETGLVQVRTQQPAMDPWATFAERLRGVNGTPLANVPELITLLERNNWRHGYCDARLWSRLHAAFPAGFTVETNFDRTRVDDYAFGITAACGAIAETGTLILGDLTTSSRLGALAPWAHIAVIERAQIFPDLTAAITALPVDPNLVFVTGPSKTADVEGILIEGVHGPGIQAALLLDR